MSDRINNLFQQRFQGHEAPVNSGVWSGIQHQLSASGMAADGVNTLFKERFQGHETPVDSSAWLAISSQLGHSAAVGTSSGTVWAWVAAGVAAVVVATGAFVLTAPEIAPPTTQVQVQPLQPAPEFPTATEVLTIGPVRTAQDQHAAPVKRKIARATHPPLIVAPPLSTAEPERHLVPASRTEPQGATVVSSIIANLEEQVLHQPVTAQPEPGLTNTPNTEPTDLVEPASEVAVEVAVPMPKLFMPNTFTPNGDGMNDTYSVDGEGYAAILLRVYSMKTNTLVFTSNSGEPWSGEGCEDGMYMVALEAHTPDGRSTTEGKVVWLTRNRTN